MTFLTEKDFKSFYLEIFPIIRTFLFSKCNEISLAEDLAQESFVRLWNNRNKIEIEKAKSFLFTVSNNLFLDHIRHHKVKNNYSASFIFQQDNKDPQYMVEMEEFRIKLESTIQSIPSPSREVFLLNRIEKLTYSQIADNLGLSVKAIEKRMQKALEIMATIKYKI